VKLQPHTLRGRITAVFAVVTVLLCALVAGFVLYRYHADLSHQLDENLETRYGDVRAEINRVPTPGNGGELPIIPRAEAFAQVLTLDGHVLAASPAALLDRPVLHATQLARARRGRVTVERSVPPRADEARLLAGTERLGNERVIVVVGSSLDELHRAQTQLEVALAIALPVLMIVVTVTGWLLVGAALRPVRSMVAEAETFSERRRPGQLSVGGPEELAELARRLNEMLARIEAALEHERAFLDNASHELRTPIAIARGELELARPLTTSIPAVRDAVDSALEEVERLEQLAANLLVLARTRAAGPTLDERVDLGTVCEHAIAAVRRAHEVDGIAIETSGSAYALGDAMALERAVGNLVENAVRHATHRVDVVVGTDAGEASIEVRDDGPGFPGSVRDVEGSRFAPGVNGGTGLGLPIVDAIATAHRGHLELDGASGSGAVARLRLPQAP
jgi:two-component system OmpR family sensor kinase